MLEHFFLDANTAVPGVGPLIELHRSIWDDGQKRASVVADDLDAAFLQIVRRVARIADGLIDCCHRHFTVFSIHRYKGWLYKWPASEFQLDGRRA